MKKTIHINLSGLAFKIEEDAYTRLDDYLKAVKAKLGADDEALETIDDITLRIGEIFKGAHAETGSAITVDDVEEVIKTLGAPEDYEIGDDPETSAEKSKDWQPPIGKRLYRDNDNRVLAGVCSGLGNYFNTDPIVFRLLFIVGLFYGISIIPYIILWIAIPKAVTVQQRIMMMGGEPGYEQWRKRQTTVVERKNFTNGALRTFAVFVGILLMVVSFFTLIAAAMAVSVSDLLFGTIVSDGAWIPELPGLLLTPQQTRLGVAGVGLIIGLPLLMLFYLGMHLVFRFKRGGSALIITALVLWLAGFGLVGYSSINVLCSFTKTASTTETHELANPSADTLYLEASSASLMLNQGRYIINTDKLEVKLKDDELLVLGDPRLRITKGGERLKITLEKKARGSHPDEARRNAQMIEYFFLQNDSVLLLDRYFTLRDKAMIRQQQITVHIEVPPDKEVIVAPELEQLVN